MTENNEKAYRNLIRLKRRFYFLLVVLIPSIYLLYVALVYIGFTIAFAQCISLIVGILAYLGNTMYFLANGTCPWCKQHFFLKDAGGSAHLKLFFGNRCRHCGMPDH